MTQVCGIWLIKGWCRHNVMPRTLKAAHSWHKDYNPGKKGPLPCSTFTFINHLCVSYNILQYDIAHILWFKIAHALMISSLQPIKTKVDIRHCISGPWTKSMHKWKARGKNMRNWKAGVSMLHFSLSISYYCKVDSEKQLMITIISAITKQSLRTWYSFTLHDELCLHYDLSLEFS